MSHHFSLSLESGSETPSSLDDLPRTVPICNCCLHTVYVTKHNKAVCLCKITRQEGPLDIMTFPETIGQREHIYIKPRRKFSLLVPSTHNLCSNACIWHCCHRKSLLAKLILKNWLTVHDTLGLPAQKNKTKREYAHTFWVFLRSFEIRCDSLAGR